MSSNSPVKALHPKLPRLEGLGPGRRRLPPVRLGCLAQGRIGVVRRGSRLNVRRHRARQVLHRAKRSPAENIFPLGKVGKAGNRERFLIRGSSRNECARWYAAVISKPNFICGVRVIKYAFRNAAVDEALRKERVSTFHSFLLFQSKLAQFVHNTKTETILDLMKCR